MLLLFSIGTFVVLWLAKDERRSRTVPEYHVQTAQGQDFSSLDMRGKVTLVQFFLTNCKSMCPTISEEVAKIQDDFLKESDFMILTHTLDPERDSLPALLAYAEKYRANENRWKFVRHESTEASFDIANDAYMVSARPDPRTHEGIAHGQKLILVDKTGTIRGYYDIEKSRRMNKIRDDIQGLLDETVTEK